MFKLSPTALEQLNLRENLNSSSAGAFCSFEGLVRDHNDGKKVIALEYDAHEALCQSEFEKIALEAKNEFKILDLKVYHRVGSLKIGDMAVWVGVIAAHRDDAFKACRYLIDELKARLPIWKKEYYVNGESKWISLINNNTSVSSESLKGNL